MNWSRILVGEPLERIEPLELGSLMTFLPRVVTAKYVGWHLIHLTFQDRAEGVVSFRKWLQGPVFEPLRELDYFRRFFVDGGTVAWPNGADIAPETLYAAVTAGRPKKPLRPGKPLRITMRPARGRSAGK